MPKLTDEQVNAIESIGTHVLVSAGAGSGKTFVLVERYINILRSNPEAQISDIIAVTYTRKAAEEMRSRLKLELTKIVASCSDEQSNLRWSKLLAELESARIGTIHSLCESVLKNFPAEAGIDPDFAIMDDLERAEILSSCLDECMRRLIEAPSESEEALLDYPIETLKEWLSEFLKSPLKYKQARSKFASSSKDSIKQFAENFVQRDLERLLSELLIDQEFVRDSSEIEEVIWADSESKLGLAQREMQAHLKVMKGVKFGAREDNAVVDIKDRWQAVIRIAEMESARTAGGAGGKDLRQSMSNVRKVCKSLCKKNPGELSAADELAILLIHGLVGLADQVLRQYEEMKSAHQKLDFDDLIERCHALLTTGSAARKQLTRNLRAVLIDEFQDTNWMQAQMLSALAADSAKLFLIGDDKQSIYKFQGADVGTFNSCKTYINSVAGSEHSELSARFGLTELEGSGELMTLSQSFRSHPEIVHFVNTVFKRVFDAHKDAAAYKSRFQALRPARQKEDELVRIDVVYTPPVEGQSAEDRSAEDRSEGLAISRWIQQKMESAVPIFDKELGQNRPLRYSDIAILLQANADFAAIEFALTQAKIPFVSIAGSGFLDRQEIYDLENMLKWLDCPQDSHALFAVLRSPMFGISDDILHELAGGGKGSLWQNLRQKSDEPGEHVIYSCVKRLQEFQRNVGQMSLPDIVRKIILDTAFDIVLLAGRSGKQRSRNVWKFLSLACRHRQMSLGAFLESLASMRKLGVKNLTDAPLSADDSVRLMTIHRSKGLEFGAVLLPRLGKSALERSQKLIFGKDFAIALDPTRDAEEEKPTFFCAASKLNSTMGEEEKKRLLYVALTRPRDYLALFITSRSRRSPCFGSWLVDALDLPEPGSEIFEAVCSSESAIDPCSWNLVQEIADEQSLIDDVTMTTIFEDTADLDFDPARVLSNSEKTGGPTDELEPDAIELFGLGNSSIQPDGVEAGSAAIFDSRSTGVSSDSDLSSLAPILPSINLHDSAAESPADSEFSAAPDALGADEIMDLDFMAGESSFPELASEYVSTFADSSSKNEPIDLSLISPEISKNTQFFKPVPWQQLVRVSCAEGETQLVNQTIAGNYFHLLMSRLGPNLELPSETTLLALCKHHSVAVFDERALEYLMKEGARLLEIFQGSGLYSVMKAASKRFHEQPYSIMRPGGEIDELRPDLLLQMPDGSWQIVDYKTDHFDLREMKKQVASHSAQLSVYVDDFESLTKVRPSAWIYFAQYGRLEPVAFTPAFQLSLPIHRLQ